MNYNINYNIEIIIIIIIIILFYLILSFLNYNDYYQRIMKNRLVRDYTKWILSDKYIAKKYAEHYGFNVPETFQLVKYPKQIDFNSLKKRGNYVIKPTDLCDSYGIYLVKNNKNLKTNQPIQEQDVINQLYKIRSTIYTEYHMHDEMYNGRVPFTGYIVEELLLNQKGEVPDDYKCYTFNGRIYYIANTYNRRVVDEEQLFDCCWYNRDLEPIKTPMTKKNYKYNKEKLARTQKEKETFNKMISLVENVSSKLKRHCRIDVYIIKEQIYLGEFTFFTGAQLHTNYCNYKLGRLWSKYPDDNSFTDPVLPSLVPEDYYNPIN